MRPVRGRTTSVIRNGCSAMWGSRRGADVLDLRLANRMALAGPGSRAQPDIAWGVGPKDQSAKPRCTWRRSRASALRRRLVQRGASAREGARVALNLRREPGEHRVPRILEVLRIPDRHRYEACSCVGATFWRHSGRNLDKSKVCTCSRHRLAQLRRPRVT
jgi:hypothetical protein